MAPILAHLDLDAFYAAVEELEDPSLRARPLVVGGDPRGRGVVATANYVARRFGIRSAMSSAEALRRCPEVVFVRPRHTLYRQYSEAVWGAIREVVPRVEQVGIDEGYLDLTGAVGTAGEAERFLRVLQAAIREQTGLDASFGCGTSKVVAKIASDHRKPRGVTVVAAGREAAFLAPLPLRALPGIGPKSDERLRAHGLTLIGDLAALSDERLAALVPGIVGTELRDRARGIDPRPVAIGGRTQSVSVVAASERNIATVEELRAIALRMADEVAARLEREARGASTVTLKLRYPDFAIATRSQTSRAPFSGPDEIGRLALIALDRALAVRPPPVRLIGVGVAKLVDAEQLRLPLP